MEMTEETSERLEQTPDAASGAPRGAAAPPPSPPPPKSVRPRTVAVVGVAIVAALWLGVEVGTRSSEGGGAEAAQATAGGKGEKAAPKYYTCGMHPWVILPHPGPCPICGMPLVPLDPAKFSGEVAIDPVIAQNIGVRLAPVMSGPLVNTIRTVGTVDYDEELVRDVNVKVAGWVQKLHVDTLGQPVRKGDPLFELYSPDLYAAQQEYLLALKGGPVGGGGKSLADAARTRLEYDDVPPSEIAALARRGRARKTMTLRSPYAGVVIEKKTFEGMRVDPGMQVFRIADLSRIWVMVTLYEYQLPYVHVGQTATMTLPYLPGERLQGKVVYVYPYLDKAARQVNIRLEFENTGQKLKPGMYATVDLQGAVGDGRRTLAPRSAVIDTGERKVAFVSKGEGHFEPRQVRTGVEAEDGMIEILDGLKPGEQVVTSGEFLLDSEAKVREGLAKMIRGGLVSGSKPEAAPTAPAAAPTAALPEGAARELTAALESYLEIGQALAAGDVVPVAAAADRVAAAADRLTSIEIPGQPHFWHQHAGAAALRDAARATAGAKTLADARRSFAAMGDAARDLVRATGVPAGVGAIEELHCPMYRQEKGGAIWLQRPGEVRNPFFGKAMLTCFDRRTPLTGAGAAGARSDQ
jgi:Cu(I)/Ag(I) efflux system membrane fusion protein